MFGLRERDIAFIVEFAHRHPAIEAVGVFGSRAVGTHRTTSDVDIVLYGADIDIQLLSEAEEVLEHKSPFPFFVDIVHWDQISDPVFQKQIDGSVRIIYRKNEAEKST